MSADTHFTHPIDGKLPPASMIRLMTLNLRFGLANDGPNGWSNRNPAVKVLLDRHPMDFYCLQEVNHFQAQDMTAMLPGYGVIGHHHPAPHFWQDNLIFHHPRWRCHASDHFFLSPTPDIPSRFITSRWPRQCTIGWFECRSESVVVVTTHFDFQEPVQKQMAGIVLSRLRRLPAHLPVVITGDFNAVPGSMPFQAFTEPEQGDSNDPVFRSAFTAPFPGTHHRFTGQSDGRHIDWILSRGNLAVHASGVVSYRIEGRYVSDHFPLWACLTHREAS